eukprot:s2168_g25.t1
MFSFWSCDCALREIGHHVACLNMSINRRLRVLFAWGGFQLPFMLSAVMHFLFLGITLFSSGSAVGSEAEPLLDGRLAKKRRSCRVFLFFSFQQM